MRIQSSGRLEWGYIAPSSLYLDSPLGIMSLQSESAYNTNVGELPRNFSNDARKKRKKVAVAKQPLWFKYQHLLSTIAWMISRSLLIAGMRVAKGLEKVLADNRFGRRSC